MLRLAATITDPAALRTDLAAVAKRGWAEDRAAFAEGVRAVAAPILGPDGACAGALSIPYVAGVAATRERAFRAGVVRCAATVTEGIGGPAGRDAARRRA